MRWTDWSGKEQVREVNMTLDLRKFEGTPGYALLVLAANLHLSIRNIQDWLELKGVGRSKGWLYKRRWLFQQPGTRSPNSKTNRDGKDERAIVTIREYPTASLRDLVRVLKAKGIIRGKDWVRTHRCL
jgi:hypothetical protein